MLGYGGGESIGGDGSSSSKVYKERVELVLVLPLDLYSKDK